MRSFKNYTKESTGAENKTTDQAIGAEELTRRIASAYNGRSNGDMLKSILAEAEKSKRAGTLSNEEIDAFYQNFAPMLDSSQKKRLRQIVERLKQI